MKSIEGTAPSRSEQARLEELWEASRQSYEQARRRQICVAWIAYHERLAGAFLGHFAYHKREQERYRQILQDICAIREGEGIETWI